MTQQTRAVNKGRFEQGDKPQGSDYVDLIDSFVSLADTTAQTMASDLTVLTLIATEVSAPTINGTTITGTTVTAQNVNASAVNSQTVSAQSVVTSVMRVLGTATMSGQAIFGDFVRHSVDTIVTAEGTTLAQANILTKHINRISSTDTGANVGVRLPSWASGLEVIVINQTGTSASCFPDTSSTRIDNLSNGTAVTLAGSARGIFWAVSANRWFSMVK